MERSLSGDEITEECRGHRGTWLWFVVNVLIFPGPSYFTLLRVREYSLPRSCLHIFITFLLLFLIVVAAALQIIVPSIGQLWMLLPLASGPIVLLMSRSLKGEFYQFDHRTVGKNDYVTMLILLMVFLVYNTLPELDLIAIKEARENTVESNFQSIPLWQDAIIMSIAILVLFWGYISNVHRSFSINRCIILFSCFVLITVQIFILLQLAFGLLKLTGGFGSTLIGVLLAAVLAIDYYDASTFGQYARRYFLLTSTKTISFILLWLCFLGLPQQLASMYANRAYNKVTPLPSHIFYQHLIFPYQGHFKSAHTAHRQLRFLYSHALSSGEQNQLDELEKIVAQQQGRSLLLDTDINQLQHTISTDDKTRLNLSFDDLPFFRPFKNDWDVMLTAIILQESLTISDLNQVIAGFKSSLPKNSQGQLPDLASSFHCRYVSYATGMKVNFISPDIERVESLLANKLIPVFYLRLAGVKYWAALVHVDHSSGLAVIRIENTSKLKKVIQLSFDADEQEKNHHEIASHQYIPMSLDYLRKQFANMAEPVVVYSNEGLETMFPDWFTIDTLVAINREVAGKEQLQKITNVTNTDNSLNQSYSGYAGYLRAITQIKQLLTQTELEPDPFLRDSQRVTTLAGGRKRLQQVAWILSQITLRDEDRMEIAYKLASGDHVVADPELFMGLVAKQPFSSDLLPCRRAFVIGRSLYLLGQHQKALDYFTIAFSRHPYTSEYEMWYRIALLKLDRQVPPPISPPNEKPGLYLYYLTLQDLKDDDKDVAKKRLETALKKDSHNILANLLLHKYFNQPLDDNFFFQPSEGF